jgi:hypothetical protein
VMPPPPPPQQHPRQGGGGFFWCCTRGFKQCFFCRIIVSFILLSPDEPRNYASSSSG